MKISRGYKFDLHPTLEAAEKMRKVIGTVRLVYNLAWEQRASEENRRRQQRTMGQNPTFRTQSVELTALRKEVDFIGEGSIAAQQQALRDVDATFKRYFKGKSGDGPKIGYPSPRKKQKNDSFRIPAKEFGLLRIPRAFGHQFHGDLATRSMNTWPPVPRHLATPG